MAVPPAAERGQPAKRFFRERGIPIATYRVTPFMRLHADNPAVTVVEKNDRTRKGGVQIGWYISASRPEAEDLVTAAKQEVKVSLAVKPNMQTAGEFFTPLGIRPTTTLLARIHETHPDTPAFQRVAETNRNKKQGFQYRYYVDPNHPNAEQLVAAGQRIQAEIETRSANGTNGHRRNRFLGPVIEGFQQGRIGKIRLEDRTSSLTKVLQELDAPYPHNNLRDIYEAASGNPAIERVPKGTRSDGTISYSYRVDTSAPEAAQLLPVVFEARDAHRKHEEPVSLGRINTRTLFRLSEDKKRLLRQFLKGREFEEIASDDPLGRSALSLRKVMGRILNAVVPHRVRPRGRSRIYKVDSLLEREPKQNSQDPVSLFSLWRKGLIPTVEMSTLAPLLESYSREQGLRLQTSNYIFAWAYFGDIDGIFVIPDKYHNHVFVADRERMQPHIGELQALVTALGERGNPLKVLDKYRKPDLFTLITRAQAHDNRALSELEYGLMKRFAHYGSDTRIMVSKILKDLPSFDVELGKLRLRSNWTHWTNTIARNTLANRRAGAYAIRETDINPQDLGCDLLYDVTTAAEYSTLSHSPKYGNLVVRYIEDGRIYLVHGGIDEFRRIKTTPRPRRIPSPSPRHRPFSEYAANTAEINAMRRAAKKGKLKARKTGVWWHALPEDVEEWRKSLSSEPIIASPPHPRV